MELSFKKADAENLDELVTTRNEVLRAANLTGLNTCLKDDVLEK